MAEAQAAVPSSEVVSGRPAGTTIRFLTPDMCRVHLGNLGALHVTVKNEDIYRGIYAIFAFPVAYPEGYISLIYTDKEKDKEKDVEIGIIRDLNEFPEAAADLVRQALRRRYFVHTISSINRMADEYGMIAFDVNTDKGPLKFYMRWSQDRAVDYGQRGKVIIDMENNRYLIPDLEKLTPRELAEFQRFVYW